MALLFSSACSVAADDQLVPAAVSVAGTAFEVVLAGGERLAGTQLIGAVLNVEEAGGFFYPVRIDDVLPDPRDAEGEITLYRLSTLNPVSGAWERLCTPDADGFAGGFPLSGTWTDGGEHIASEDRFTITCTSGTSGKCVRMGYKPWKTRADGVSLWDLHQACTRMLRADYCGDGVPHTRDGTPVEVFDTLGIQAPDPASGLSFEAAWGPEGAICIRRPRIPELMTLDALLAACARLRERLGDDCREVDFLRPLLPVILNRS